MAKHAMEDDQVAESGSYNSVAVLIPCYNEEQTVGKVVADYLRYLPGSRILVFDNNSSDGTVRRAREAGATVVASHRQGKGHVVRHMFSEVEAEIYVMVDGDDTYPAEEAPRLVDEFLRVRADMVVGTRIEHPEVGAFRAFHRFGNHLVARLISMLFGIQVTDVMSGYRVFSRDFVKAVPLFAKGFEIETEMTLQAAAKEFSIREIPVEYRARPKGSISKLNTYSDGFLVLKTILSIFKDYKPLVFFTFLSAFLGLLSLASGLGPVEDFVTTGLVPRFPRAILAAGLGILSALSLSVGVILETLVKFERESYQLWRRMAKWQKR